MAYAPALACAILCPQDERDLSDGHGDGRPGRTYVLIKVFFYLAGIDIVSLILFFGGLGILCLCAGPIGRTKSLESMTVFGGCGATVLSDMYLEGRPDNGLVCRRRLSFHDNSCSILATVILGMRVFDLN